MAVHPLLLHRVPVLVGDGGEECRGVVGFQQASVDGHDFGVRVELAQLVVGHVRRQPERHWTEAEGAADVCVRGLGHLFPLCRRGRSPGVRLEPLAQAAPDQREVSTLEVQQVPGGEGRGCHVRSLGPARGRAADK